ncbi:TPA: hypothetical protein I8235_000758 [Kluyvera intermedia]|nr:hypothetical protein [Kluyvera intermedia]
MLKSFIVELLWVFLFIFFIFVEKNIPTYLYARVNLPEMIISWISWGLLFLCGLRIAWCMEFSSWWLCGMYAFIISIAIFVYNFVVYKLDLPTDFPGVTGSIWLSTIFYVLSFSLIFAGFIAGKILKSLLFK